MLYQDMLLSETAAVQHSLEATSVWPYRGVGGPGSLRLLCLQLFLVAALVFPVFPLILCEFGSAFLARQTQDRSGPHYFQ